MKLIAHRGLVDGPDKNLENHPDQISKALDLGFDAEVDLWIVNSDFYLGHDGPQYPIPEKFLETYGLWIHAKNLPALRWLTKTSYWYFWHQEDDFTLTSNHYIWTYPDKDLTLNSIRLMPEWKDPELKTVFDYPCAGICSDFVARIKAMR